MGQNAYSRDVPIKRLPLYTVLQWIHYIRTLRNEVIYSDKVYGFMYF